MRNIVLVCLVISLLIVSCSKDSTTNNPNTNPTSNRASFKWTYSGATYSADTVTATSATTIAGVTYNPEIYAQTGPWATPTTSFLAKISSLNPGSYGETGQNSFTESTSTGTDYLSPFSITISSNSNNLISGSFSGTLNGQPISGAFSNVAIH